MSVAVVQAIYTGISGTALAATTAATISAVVTTVSTVGGIAATIHGVNAGSKARRLAARQTQAYQATQDADRHQANTADDFSLAVGHLRSTGTTPAGTSWDNLNDDQQAWAIQGDYQVTPKATRSRA